MKAGMRVKVGCSVTLVAALAGCGGGGGNNSNNSPPPQPTFSVGGTLSGVAGSVVLQNNGAGNLTVNANGTFTFTGPLNSGAAYNVTVLTPPGLQACSVANGSGTVSANVTNVAITCTDVSPPTLALTLEKTKLFRFAWNSAAGSTHYRLQEDPTGSSGFTQLGADIPASATNIDEVATLHRRFNARYFVQACAGSRCIDSNTVSVTGSLAEAVGYFKASNPHPGALFGTSIALSRDGTTLAVGARGERSIATGIDGDQSDAGAGSAGAVYVFTLTGNAWTQQAYVKASNTQIPPPGGRGDEFGTSVALSADGSILAVGAVAEDSNATGVGNDESDDSAERSGAVYVFSRAGATWAQQAYIKASNTERRDQFGHAVALSADGLTLAVGATGEDSGFRDTGGGNTDNSQPESGAVYVFARPIDTDTWAQQAYVKASNTDRGDEFGASLALSADGQTLVVGAPLESSGATEDSEPEPESGAVYVFGRSGTDWSEHAHLKASNAGASDFFGTALALSANGATLAVVAHSEDGSDDLAHNSGAVYVFARSPENVWGPEAYITASNAGDDDHFGISVALSADGQTLVVGAIGEDSNAAGIGGDETDNSALDVGAVYAFTRSGTSWGQQAYIKASNAGVSMHQRFSSVALSGDATVLAVGAVNESSSSGGINGDENSVASFGAGAVYVY